MLQVEARSRCGANPELSPTWSDQGRIGMRKFAIAAGVVIAVAVASPAIAADPKGKTDQPIAAKQIFGAAKTAAPLAARAIGSYARGCLSGATAVPIDGDNWQVMRLSRNRNWGHPKLVTVVKRLAKDSSAKDGWAGILVGDLSQPRGGPMLTGHASHQIGLDADIWLTPMPGHRMTRAERENLSATSMLSSDRVHADPSVFSAKHAAIIRRAASYAEVERVLVHPGIKKAMCEETGVDRKNFHKIRPYWGHHYHMHIRIGCPAGSTACRPQPVTSNDDGCGKEVNDWIALLQRPPAPPKPGPKPTPKPPITLADLPSECRIVVEAGKDEAEKVPATSDQAASPPR